MLNNGAKHVTFLGAGWLLFSCSVLYDLSPDQCGSDVDCESFGPNYQCNNGLCQADGGRSGSSGSSGASGNSGKGGTSSQGGDSGEGGTSEGGTSSGKGGASGAGGSSGQGGSSGKGGSAGSDQGECETTADCEALRENFDIQPAACIERTPGDPSSRACVDLKSDQCPVILPDVGRELWLENLRGQSPIILGAFANLPSSFTSVYSRNFDLAFSEFTDKQLGVPGPGGITRPFVVVVCKNNYPLARADLDDALDHLISLKVPGILATLASDDLQYAFSHIGGASAKVFFMSPVESDSTLANIEDENLLWHLLPSGTYVAQPYAPLLTRTLDYLVSSSQLGDTETVRVALVTATDLRLLTDSSETIKQTIIFNGKSAAENFDDGNFREVNVSSVYEDPDDTLATQIQALLSFAPHVIIGSAADEFFSKIIPGVETGWPTAMQPAPFYLLSPYHIVNNEQAAALTNFPSIAQRVAGVAYASIVDNLRPILQSYHARYDAQFTDDAGRRGYENYYDAPYYLMYGIVAGARNLTRFDGSDIAAGMARIRSGPVTYRVHPDDIPGAVGTLGNATSSITLNGTLGAPNFDATGARSDFGSVFCLDPSSNPVAQADVLRYDGVDLVGTFPCITGF